MELEDEATPGLLRTDLSGAVKYKIHNVRFRISILPRLQTPRHRIKPATSSVTLKYWLRHPGVSSLYLMMRLCIYSVIWVRKPVAHMDALYAG